MELLSGLGGWSSRREYRIRLVALIVLHLTRALQLKFQLSYGLVCFVDERPECQGCIHRFSEARMNLKDDHQRCA